MGRWRLFPGAWDRPRTSVDLDTRHDALLLQHIHEGLAIGSRLVQRLLEHDTARDTSFAQACMTGAS